jgi:hypothetical protein
MDVREVLQVQVAIVLDKGGVKLEWKKIPLETNSFVNFFLAQIITVS